MTTLNSSEETFDTRKSDVMLTIAFRIKDYTSVCAVTVVLLFFMLLAHLEHWLPRAKVILKTLSLAYSDMLYFLILFLVIFFAFVIMSNVYYGADLPAFASAPVAMQTLFLMLLGNLSFLNQMIILSQPLTLAFLILFLISMHFILLNIITAFISKSYIDVKE